MAREVKHGGTKDLDGPVSYGGSRDELNALLRQKDDLIDELRREIYELQERLEEIRSYGEDGPI